MLYDTCSIQAERLYLHHNYHLIMFRHFLFLIFTIFPTMLYSQTVRVCNGVHTDGCRSFVEVYEYDYVEHKPEFPGGSTELVDFINKQRRYPAQAYHNGIEGRVLCAFIINTDGTVSNVSVLKGVEVSLNQEAVRIISAMPAWTPGSIDGRSVPVRVIWPVPFRK